MNFKKIFAFAILFVGLFSIESQAQLFIQMGQVSLDGEKTNVIPRYSWGGISFFEIEDTPFEWGIALDNQGLIFDQGADRIVHRGIGLGASLGAKFDIGEKLFFRVAYVPEYFFHYKHKTFIEKSRKNKMVNHTEWFSDRMNQFNHSIDVSFGLNVFALNFRWFFNELLNKEYTDLNGVKPFENIDSQMFNIGITWNLKDIVDDEEEEEELETTRVF